MTPYNMFHVQLLKITTVGDMIGVPCREGCSVPLEATRYLTVITVTCRVGGRGGRCPSFCICSWETSVCSVGLRMTHAMAHWSKELNTGYGISYSLALRGWTIPSST